MWKKIGGILNDLYAALWRNTTGVQWTYLARRWAAAHPRSVPWVLLPAILLTILLQLVGGWVGVVVGDFLFLLLGHLYWDTAGSYLGHRKRRPAGTPKDPPR